jgi:putative acetyltransferase
VQEITIRPEQERDYENVRGLLVLAFGRENEAKLVAALRNEESYDPEISLIAVVDRQLAGHILFSPLTIESDGGVVPALALAPLAVRPDFQKQGVGSALVHQGLEAARGRGHRIVIVVGDPAYYSRFGFTLVEPLGLTLSLDIPLEVVGALELVPGALAGVKGVVVYPEVFLLT